MTYFHDSNRPDIEAINAEWVFGRCALLDELVHNVNRLAGSLHTPSDPSEDFAVKYNADLRAVRTWLEFEGLILRSDSDPTKGKWTLVDLSTTREMGPYRMCAVACLAVRHLRPDILDGSP